MAQTETPSGERVRIAVVGAGPAGFYGADALLRARDLDVRVDLFDRLPTPYGLLRAGVAPDHQSIKAAARSFEKVGRDPRVRFFGNVQLGRDLQASELARRYRAVIYAVGAESDRALGIPGEDLEGVHSATEFVFWYNGHPDYRGRRFDLSGAERAAVIGNGNVAMDVTRVLTRDPAALAVTDIAGYAAQALRESALREVLLVGRRGPAQAAFSNKEIREIAELPGVDLVVDPRYAALQAATLEAAAERPLSRAVQKNVAFLQARAALGEGERPRKVRCWFRTSPVAFLGEGGRLSRIRFVENRMELRDGKIHPAATENVWDEPVQIAFKAIGYRGVPLPGVPFDPASGTIPNDGGRVLEAPGGAAVRGCYVVGWARRGPRGLLGSNRPDARSAVAALIADLPGLRPAADPAPIEALLAERGVRWTSFEDWLAIDAEERRRGESRGKLREKFTDVEEMLAFSERRAAPRGGA